MWRLPPDADTNQAEDDANSGENRTAPARLNEDEPLPEQGNDHPSSV